MKNKSTHVQSNIACQARDVMLMTF